MYESTPICSAEFHSDRSYKILNPTSRPNTVSLHTLTGVPGTVPVVAYPVSPGTREVPGLLGLVTPHSGSLVPDANSPTLGGWYRRTTKCWKQNRNRIYCCIFLLKLLIPILE